LSFMGKDRELLWVYREMPNIKVDKPTDIILTPEFYTIKKETLPVKYTHQAKRIAASLFDGLVDQAGSYHYFVYKEDDRWVFIAYQPDMILSFLQARGIDPVYVKKIFFADQVSTSLSRPIALGDGKALVSLSGSAVVVPLSALERDEVVPPYRVTLPKKGITLEGKSTSLLGGKETLWLSVLIIAFGLLWIAEGWEYRKSMQNLNEKKDEMYQAYPRLQNPYTRKSIIEKYQKIDKSEREKRAILKALSSIISKDITVDMLRIEAHRCTIHFSIKKRSDIKKLERFAQKEGFTIKEKGKGYVTMEKKW